MKNLLNNNKSLWEKAGFMLHMIGTASNYTFEIQKLETKIPVFAVMIPSKNWRITRNIYTNDCTKLPCLLPGRVALSVAHLTQEPEVPGSIPDPAITFVSPSFDSRRTVVGYRRQYVHIVLVNRLGSLTLLKNSVVRPSMTIAVYRGRKATKQQ